MQVISVRRFFLVPLPPVTCFLVLLFLFMSSHYLGRCSFSHWYSCSGNWNCWNCKKRLFVDWLYYNVTQLLSKKNCKINCIFGKGYLLKGCIKRRRIPKVYVKHGLSLLSRDYLVVWVTMMGWEMSVYNYHIDYHIYTNIQINI